MKRTLLLTVALASTLWVLPAPSRAAEAAQLAVVNVQEIMAKSSAAKSIRTQLESTSKTYQSQIAKEEETLRTQKDELGKQRSALTKDAFEQKAEGFQKSVMKVQRDANMKKAQLNAASSNAAAEVQKAVQDIIAEMAKERGFVLAVPTSQVLYAGSNLDITEEVLKRLDQKLPKVTVKIPSVSAKPE